MWAHPGKKLLFMGGELAQGQEWTNLSPVPRAEHRLGLPRVGRWHEALNTDSPHYGEAVVVNLGAILPEPVPWHGQPVSAEVTLPPLAAVWLVPDGD